MEVHRKNIEVPKDELKKFEKRRHGLTWDDMKFIIELRKLSRRERPTIKEIASMFDVPVHVIKYNIYHRHKVVKQSR